MKKAICAGMTGAISWVSCYPMDLVKARIQNDKTIGRSLRVRDVWREIMLERGVFGLFKALGPTVVRSFVINAITLPTLELLNDKYVRSADIHG